MNIQNFPLRFAQEGLWKEYKGLTDWTLFTDIEFKRWWKLSTLVFYIHDIHLREMSITCIAWKMIFLHCQIDQILVMFWKVFKKFIVKWKMKSLTTNIINDHFFFACMVKYHKNKISYCCRPYDQSKWLRNGRDEFFTKELFPNAVFLPHFSFHVLFPISKDPNTFFLSPVRSTFPGLFYCTQPSEPNPARLVIQAYSCGPYHPVLTLRG